MVKSEGKSKRRRRRCGEETPPAAASSALVPTVHPQVFDEAIRPVLRQIARDLGGITLDYEVIFPGRLPGSVNDIRLTIGVTFPEIDGRSNAELLARFDAIQEEAMTRFLAWFEDWEQMQGLPPTKGGWHTREVYDG